MEEMEFKDTSKRRKGLLILGVVLALAAGGGAFYLVSSAQSAPKTDVPKRTIVVAAHDIATKTVIAAGDLTVRSVPDDPSVAVALTDPAQVIGRLTGVPIQKEQPITANLLASSTAGAQFSILAPNETIGPNTPLWRAVAIDVPDDRAVGGQLQVAQHVDIFVTAQVNVVLATPSPVPGATSAPQPSPTPSGAPGIAPCPQPGPATVVLTGNSTVSSGAPGSAAPGATPAAKTPAPSPSPSAVPCGNGPFYTDKTTKVTYQDVTVLAKNGTMYVLKVDEHVAEEISHLQASGNSMFSMALRPDGDHRAFGTTDYGETTNQIIEQYGMPIPRVYPEPQK